MSIWVEYVSKGFGCKRMEGDAEKGEERQVKGGLWGEEILKPHSEQSNAQQMPV